MAPRKPTRYNAGVFSLAGLMRDIAGPLRNRRGLTVLALVLLIIAVVVVVLISRYVAV